MNDTSFAAVLPYRGWWDEGICDLRYPGVMCGYELHGLSPETSSPIDRWNAARQLGNACIHLRTGDMVQVIFQHDPIYEPPQREFPTAAGRLLDMELRERYRAGEYWETPASLYLTHRFETPLKRWTQQFLFATDGSQPQKYELLCDEALRRFSNFLDAAVTGVKLRHYNSTETYNDLLRCVMYRRDPALLPARNIRLNEIIGYNYFFGGLAPMLEGWHLRPITILMYPVEGTRPQILAELLRQAGPLTISTRFICLSTIDAQQTLENEKPHWDQIIGGGLWGLISRWWHKREPEEMDARAQKEEIEEVKQVNASGVPIGYGSMTVIVRDTDPDRADLRAREMMQSVVQAGLLARIEDYRAVEAVYSSWPGDYDHNVCRPLITAYNFADMVLPAEYWRGAC